MDNLKKIGFSALAGSLVSFSAATAGELTISGAAEISYSNFTGNEDGAQVSGGGVGDVGTNFGKEQLVTISGSGELDNGMTVSMTAYPKLNGAAAAGSTSILSLDMGSMGTVSYSTNFGNIGIDKLDNVMPSAYEEVTDGPVIYASNRSSGASNAEADDLGGNAYEVEIGCGFDYSLAANDMVTLGLGYSENGGCGTNDDGSVGGTDGADNATSVHAVIKPMDGLTLYAGTAEKVKDDQEVLAAVYSMGPVSVGIQKTEIDLNAANDEEDSDSESTAASIAFAVNENLSISYGIYETEIDSQSKDQEVSGFDIGYSMGGIGINAYRHKGENMGGFANNESEKTEIRLSFAF
jgi:outer membrane protein OmpU